LTGLSKPLPRASLTARQDFDVETRLWSDKIAGLQHERLVNGEWRFEHCGRTMLVRQNHEMKRADVCARGVCNSEVGSEGLAREVEHHWVEELDEDGEGQVEMGCLEE
jgi:hypothetical protein